MAAPKVFVSHSHKDDAFATVFADSLLIAGANAWMDKTDIGAGNFQQRIDEALAHCEWFVLVLTREALASPWVQQEVYAANRLKNQGKIHDLIFIQAGPVDHSELPPLWGVFNIFDARKNYHDALNMTLKVVGLRPVIVAAEAEVDQLPEQLADLGFTAHSDKGVEYILPPLCRVPAGPFLMGSDPKRDKMVIESERPQHTVTLPAYEIARFPVTVAEYACFVRAIHGEPKDWKSQLAKLDHPVVNVTWHDAMAFAAWLAERTGEWWRLATEAEWEKAARGIDGRTYPWGDSFDKARCNTEESGIGTTTPVGSYPNGASPCGAQDMVGNVWEWTSSLYNSYPYSQTDGRESPDSTRHRVLRGGSWCEDTRGVRAACRLGDDRPGYFSDYIGFRVVWASPSS